MVGPGIKERFEGEQPKHPQNFVAALLCCFLSVTGGVTLGGILFPSDEEHPNAEFQVAGMQIGLLAAAVSSWVAFFRSKVYCGVPGGIFPPVIALSSTYFKQIGPENPHTIMLALPAITIINGLGMYLAARLPLEQAIKGIPYTVFGGFMAGTGVVCIQSGLEMAAGVPVVSEQFWSTRAAHWVPALLTAALVYAGQQRGAPMRELLLPAALFLLALAFYATRWLLGHGLDLASARADGFLYGVAVPSSPGFYHVWTLQDWQSVRWEYLLDSSFLFAVASSFCLSVLCIVEDLYGVVELARVNVSMRGELETAALMNVVSGLVGSMPTNLVMSYSVTAYKSGATSRVFLWYLSIISSIVFLVADYVIAAMPKMVPAAAAVWVGIAMSWDWIYDGIGKLSPQDYAVLWMMILIDLIKGPDIMMAFGLCVTCLQLAHRLSGLEVIEASHTCRTERSSTLYAIGKDAALEDHGDRAMILHLSKGLLFFGSAFQMQERVEQHLASCSEPLLFLVLDFGNIEDVEVSGMKVLHFIVHDLAEAHDFTVVLVGMKDIVEEHLVKFFIDTTMMLKFQGMNEALRHIEADLLKACRANGDPERGTLSNPDLGLARQLVKDVCRSVCGDLRVLPVAVDVHIWLNSYVKSYVAAEVLPCLVKALKYKKFTSGAIVCSACTRPPPLPCDLEERCPLVWVLSGRVDLLHDVEGEFEVLPEHSLPEHHGAGRSELKAKDLVQIAEVARDRAAEEPACAGPLDTLSHFFFAFQVPSVMARVASQEAAVAMLSYSDFVQMPPQAADLLQHYTARKKFVSGAMSKPGN